MGCGGNRIGSRYGFYVAGAITTGLVVVVLVVFDRFERTFMLSKRDALFVQVSDRPGQLGAIASILGRYGISIKEVDMETIGKGHEAAIHLNLEIAILSAKDRLLDEITEVEGVIHVGYESEC